jgi:hypothetical protein
LFTKYISISITCLLLQLEFPSVTNARASEDYVSKVTNAQAIAGSSLLFGALAIAPSKDTFWTTSPQPPTMSDTERNYTTQPHVQLDTVLATLSMGPVGFSDALNLTDAALINQTCMANGTILRPSRPLSWVNSYFRNASNPSDVRCTHVNVPGIPSPAGWYIVAWTTNMPVTLATGDLYPSVPPGTAIASRLHNFSGSAQAGCVDGEPATPACVSLLQPGSLPIIPATGTEAQDFSLTHIVPQLDNGWFFLGELAKISPLAPQRFVNIQQTTSPSGLSVTMQGVPGETVTATAVTPSGTVQVLSVTFSTTRTSTIAFST